MNKELTVTTSIEINADKAKVWDALTNPEKIKVYLFGTETLTDWKTGSEIIFQGEYQGHQYKDKGIILDIQTDKILQYSYWSGFSGLEDKPENYSLVSYKLDKTNEKTLLTLTQTGFANEQAQQHSQTAWTNVLQQIKQMTE
ncbi:MAG: SRPBCC domain-containing protein [Flavobacteriaceae bacterium]|nr:MAG: SRPBCC domain-containing protein [Flavobacteriaceae bacterium]